MDREKEGHWDMTEGGTGWAEAWRRLSFFCARAVSSCPGASKGGLGRGVTRGGTGER